MKKRLFSLLLIIALVLGMVVMPAGAAPVETYETCPHCGTPWELCGWQELIVEEPDRTIPSGHYYLAEDTNTVKQYMIGTSDGQSADLAVDVCLDLRGYKLEQTTANRRAFYVFNYSTFGILDSVGGGKIIGTGNSSTAGGSGGTIYTCANAQVHLYGGALVNAQKNRTKNGGVVYIAKNGNFTMHGGIIDGSAVTVLTDEAKSQYPRAAAVQVAGNLTVEDGLIIGGAAYQGGTIAVDSAGRLVVNGGTIMGGSAASHGGCIYSQGFVQINDGLITGGFSKGRGGNIYSSGTNAALEIHGGIIENGQCSTYGGNVTAMSGTCQITGGTIRGNAYAGTSIKMSISGTPVIDHYGYEGLTVATGAILTLNDLADNARITLWGTGAMTEAATSPNVATYLQKGILAEASRYALEVVDGVLTGSQDDNGYCPHCQQEITWEVYTASTNTSGHYYIPSGGVALAAGSAGLTIPNGVEIVLNLAHGSAKPAAPYQVSGSLSVLSTASSVGRIYTTAANTTANGATINITSTGTVNLYDGILGASTADAVVTSGNGGVVCVGNGGQLNIYGGWITGNTAASGGAVYTNGAKAKVNLVNGVIAGGRASSGGNVYLDKGTFTMSGGIVMGGSADAAGNIYNYTGATFNMNGGIVALGKSTKTGGNLRHAATSCKTYMRDGIFYGGEAATDGGNVYANNGIFEMTGGQLINGVAAGHSGNLYAHAGNYYIKDGKDPDANNNYIYIGDKNTADDIPAPVIIGGRATSNGGNIHASGNLYLGKCTVRGGISKVGQDLYLNNMAYLRVESGFAGKLIMTLSSTRITELDTGRALANTTMAADNAEIYVDNYDMARLLRNEAGQLALGGASLVDMETGAQEWYLSAQEAAEDCESDQYVRLYAPNNTLELKKSATVDLNGTNLTVTGNGSFYGFDSENDDYEGCGAATVTGLAVESIFLAPNGNRYVAVTENGTTSFHRLSITVSNAVLRPSIAGVYFKSTWSCDDVLAQRISTYGVAVSAVNMPGADFATDGDTLYTAFDKASFVSGQPQTSVMIRDIIKEGEDNDARGTQQIYVSSYVVLADGAVVVGDDRQAVGGAVTSMLKVTQTIDRIWPKLDEAQREGVKTLYNLDATALGGWDLYNITAAINGTPAHRPLKILTLGHSLALDAGHMLNLVAAAEGFTDLTVATLYYSGCPLYKHVNFLQSDSPEYSLYVSSSNTPDQPPVIEKGVTMKYAVQYDDWDIIIMQGGVFEIAKDDTYTNGDIQIIQNYVNEHKTNPDAIFAWNSPWAPPTTNSLRDKYPYKPNSYYTSYEQYDNDRLVMYGAITSCLEKYIVTDDSFVYLIPSCTAIENANSSYLEETDIYRDYVHMNDFGRVITSYTWYCILAGVDHLDEVQLDAIPVAFFKTTKGTTDRVLTDAEKQIIIESVNNALANPLELTQSQYTTAP